MFTLVGVNLLAHSVESLNHALLHLRHEVLGHAHASGGVLGIDVVLKLSKRQLVTVLVLPVAFGVFLDGVIR